MQSINRFFYGPSPEEKVRAWQRRLKGEQRHLDREIRQVRVTELDYKISHFIEQLDMATNKARVQLKQLAAKGDTKSAKILAKEVVRSNKQKDRLHVSKARLGSIEVQLTQQMGGPADDYDTMSADA